MVNPSTSDGSEPPTRFAAAAASDASYSLECVSGACRSSSATGWYAQGNGSCSLVYASGRSLPGVLSVKSGCSAAYWGDGSTWFKEVVRRPPEVTVHLVPHSHLDPGWLSTASDMYTGRNFSPSIRSLISEVIAALANESSRTFAPEHAVFHAMWWRDATEHDKALVRRLVSEGRLEWAGGGWVQHDEAVTRFEDQIDQMALGKLWLQSNTGTSRVSAAWQADPFGHSLASTYLFALAGYDGYVFGRGMTAGDPINEQTAALWHPFRSFPDPGYADASTLLTHEQRSGYWNPFRANHDDLVKRDIPAVRDRLLSYIDNIIATSRPSASNVLIMFGDDHRWEDAGLLFPAVDASIAAINAVSNTTGIKIHYSTPSRFFNALHAEDLAFPARQPEWDMVQLIGCEFPAPWVGYYTSRPNFKMRVRAASSLWRAAQKMHALARDPSKWLAQFRQLRELWEAVSLAQHHDAVTGDEFGVVEADYSLQLERGVAQASMVASQALAALSGHDTSNHTLCLEPALEPCIGVMDALARGMDVLLSVYNPTAAPRSQIVEVLIPAAAAEGAAVLREADGEPVPCQTAAPWEVPGAAEALNWLVFRAVDLPPLGDQRYVISLRKAAGLPGCHASPRKRVDDGTAVLSNGKTVLDFESGMMTAMREASGAGLSIRAMSQVLVYSSANGAENSWDFSTDGAGYASAKPFPRDGGHTFMTSGPLFQELTTAVNRDQGVTTRYRLYAGDDLAHVYVSSGPLDVGTTNRSQDVILRIDTDIDSGGALYTDSNGLEFVRRTRNRRPWQVGNWTDHDDRYREPVASNYYPVTLAAVLPTADGRRHSNPALAVLPAGMLGAASLRDGSVELMVNRAVLSGNAGDPVSCENSTSNEKVTQHLILMLRDGGVQEIASASAEVRTVAAHIANPVLLFARPWLTNTTGGGRGTTMGVPLPPQLELLTLLMLPPGMNVSFESPGLQQPPLRSSACLLRIRHMYAAGDGGPGNALGRPVTLDLRAALAPWLRVTEATEMTIDGMQPAALAARRRLRWKQVPGEGLTSPTQPLAAPTTFVIRPMEVRTWRLAVGPGEEVVV